MPSRNEIRKEKRQQRRSLDPHTQRINSIKLARKIASTDRFRRAQRIACYAASDGEIDLTPLVRHAQAIGKQCYLPVLNTLTSNRLWFAPITDNQTHRINKFGISEPVVPYSAFCRPWALDLILMPLVAFDGSGNRLGMGGGFYDRTLAYKRRRKCWRKPPLVGVAHSFQEWGELDARSWDIPLDGVITELGFLEF